MVIYNDVSLFYEQMEAILWSIHTFWYKGLAKIKEKVKFEKMSLSCKNSSPGSKADLSEKFVFGIPMLILSRYHIKRPIYDIILNF